MRRAGGGRHPGLADQFRQIEVLAVEHGVPAGAVGEDRQGTHVDFAAAPADPDAFEIDPFFGLNLEGGLEIGELHLSGPDFPDRKLLGGGGAHSEKIFETQVEPDLLQIGVGFRKRKFSVVEEKVGSGRKFAVFEPQRRAERNRRGRGGLSERGQIGAESQRFGRGEGRQRDFEEQVGSALFAGRQPTVEVQPGVGEVRRGEFSVQFKAVVFNSDSGGDLAERGFPVSDLAGVEGSGQFRGGRQRQCEVEIPDLDALVRIFEAHAAGSEQETRVAESQLHQRRVELEAVSFEVEVSGSGGKFRNMDGLAAAARKRRASTRPG